MQTRGPKAPLPPPLTSDEPGSWAFDTMSRRVRTDILARIYRENSFLPCAIERLSDLDTELANAAETPLSLLKQDGGPDVAIWNEHILPPVIRDGLTWLSAPWVTAEFYLYRRIMGAIDYFKERVDPFTLQKELGITSAIASIDTLAIRANSVHSSSASPAFQQTISQMQTFILTSLWGNRMDLSLWPVGGGDTTTGQGASSVDRATEAFSSVLDAGQRMILSNHIKQLSEYVQMLPRPSARMDIIVDNAGFELFCDLCLADFLIYSGLASCVHLQLKAHPTFVSDAMEKDVKYTVEFLRKSRSDNGHETAQSALGDRWASHIASGKWLLTENFFWVQPQPMWEMPDKLHEDMATSSLVFVKGDANYRRLLGERHWDFDTPFEDILSYFPAPVCALRTLKAEIGCGMSREATQRVSKEDPNWLTAGKYGVIQFCNSRS